MNISIRYIYMYVYVFVTVLYEYKGKANAYSVCVCVALIIVRKLREIGGKINGLERVKPRRERESLIQFTVSRERESLKGR